MIMMFFQVVIIIAFTLGSINYLADLAFYLQNRFCRFHIGRWSRENWELAIRKKAVRWLKHTPIVKITDNSRYMLIDIITNRYQSNTIQSWQKAALILGLLGDADVECRNKVKQAASQLFNSDGSWKRNPTRVDCGMLSYALMKATDDIAKIKKAMDISIAIIEKSINAEGMISYTGQVDNPDMYVDTIGLCCPFLTYYAKKYSAPKYETIAFYQLEMYHKYGLFKESSIPNHAFHLTDKLPLGVYGWGRGTGWYIIGLMDSLESMVNEDYRQCVTKWVSEAAENYMQFQHQDGGFGAIIQSEHTYDSSATAVMAWFYAKCSVLFGSKEYSSISQKCLNKLLRCTRINGAIDWCQGDTKGIGIFSQTYDIMPFAQGMTIRALNDQENSK